MWHNIYLLAAIDLLLCANKFPKMMIMMPYKKCSFFWLYDRAAGEGLNTMGPELLSTICWNGNKKSANRQFSLNDSNFNSNSDIETESDSKAKRKRETNRDLSHHEQRLLLLFFYFFLCIICVTNAMTKKSEKCSRALIIMLIAWPNCWILWKGKKGWQGERER